MKAIVCTRYGDPLEVLQLKEVDKPVPTEGRVLVRVHAASVNKADLAPVRGAIVARLLGTGLLKPKRAILGDDLAGTVEAVGKDVTRFKPGDEVFGDAPGAFAEYASASQDLLVSKPANVSFEEAAAVPIAAISALQGLRKAHIQAGQKVLVNGASGGVGTFALQIAKSFDTQVTAVCSSGNLENARAMGADHVVDYTKEDFSRNGQRYDLILAANGDQPLRAYSRALTPQGTCIVAGGSLTQIFQSLILGRWYSKSGGQTIAFMGIAELNQEDLAFLKELLENCKIKPWIDRRYPLGETARAVRYLEEGHATGKVVINVK